MIWIYCHGERCRALYIGDGRARCLCCNTIIRAVCPS